MSASDDLKDYFKNHLRNKRLELNLSQEKMAEKLGISLHSYSELERGKTFCSLETFSHYVKSCDTDANKLLSDIAEISSKSKE